jgi:hypothetical protein
MQCDICFRTGGHRLPLLCPTDARNQLYEPRIQNARVLLEKATLDQQVTALLSQQSKREEQGNRAVGTKSTRQDVVNLASETDQAADRTQQIIAHADELRVKVEKAREEIAKKKASLARRKSELASVSNGIDARRTRQLEEVDKSVRMTRYKWNQAHSVTATSRTFLCGEAAKLYGLKKVRRTGGVEEYRIGGVSIVDLRAMNSKVQSFVVEYSTDLNHAAATPAHISTVLSHIVHLLMLSTHYLAIRLPAEVTLPHRDYPLPTIFSLASSYTHTDVPFPGTTPGHSSSNSPTASRHVEQSNQPRPRPLFIKKPLPIVANEDPASYALFLEGVTLLAYDIAWVCKSQGIPVGEGSTFEDICNIGKNFFNLLIGPQTRPAPGSRTPSVQSTPTNRDGESEVEDKKNGSGSVMGRYSHGTAHSFLGNADGTEFIRSWKLMNPTKLADRLKAKLMSEVANAEWELLDQDAWAVDDEMADDGVVVGARKEVERGLGLGMQSFMSMRTELDALGMVGGDGDRKPGTSGWTKLKPR